MNPLYLQPFEAHVFEVSKTSDYLCERCSRPRSMHVNDGFLSVPDHKYEPRDGFLLSRRHPFFTPETMIIRPILT